MTIQDLAGRRQSFAIGCSLMLVILGVNSSSTRADVIYNNLAPGDGFHEEFNFTAAGVYVDFPLMVEGIRAAARFNVVGGSFILGSVTLPISVQRNVGDNILRVRLTEDAGGAPGNTLETLSENLDVWPPFSNPFTTTTTLTSGLNPLLAEGASYWIVTEPTSVPGGQPFIVVDFAWFTNTTGSTTLFRQQQVIEDGALPSDPWTGFSGQAKVAFRVEGSPVTFTPTSTPTDAQVSTATPTPTPTPTETATHTAVVEIAPCTTAPAAGCRLPVATKGRLLIKVNATHPERSRLLWKWSGAATAKDDFGNPMEAEDYHLCVYDAGVLVSTTRMLAGSVCAGQPCWRETAKGFRFKDKTLMPDGAERVKLKEGDTGKAQVVFRGRGAALEVPVLTALTGPVEVQLKQASDRVCWSTTFIPPFAKQNAALFLDISD